jgi:hypothetical protein
MPWVISSAVSSARAIRKRTRVKAPSISRALGTGMRSATSASTDALWALIQKASRSSRAMAEGSAAARSRR